jgi:thioredoxin reductase
MFYDVFIIGGGASGVSCGLILGSAYKKQFAQDKKIAIIAHQKASSLQDAIFYNAYGVSSGKLGTEILKESLEKLQENYPHVSQISDEKIVKSLLF